jgi:glycosyltransferase involved in cell wall biosynthesis
MSAAERPVCLVRLHTPLSVLYKYNTGQTRHGVLEEYENQGIRAADRRVSPSQALTREIRAQLGESLAVDVLPYPADPTFLSAQAHGGPADGDEVLYVGRFEERKGVETLARAAAAFFGACPQARLVMIGRDVPKSPRLPSTRRLVREAVPPRYRDRLTLLDRIPRAQLMERYRAARFCVFPSHFENFPNTCLEAMSLGRCVVGTDNSGMAEMIEDGVSGVIVEAANVESLADAMIRLYRMPAEQRSAMGRAAHQRMRDRYRPDVVAAELEALYGGYVEAHPYRPAGRVAPEAGPLRVAVVVPCYNHGEFLPEALKSIRAQTHADIECVVVDDGSTDERTLRTLEDVRQQGVRVIRQENQGLAAARNAGVRATQAAFFVPLDADDRLDPRFVERLLPGLLADPSLGYCYSHVGFFDAATGTWECPEYVPRRLLVENLSVATALIRRSAFDEAGGYSSDMEYGFEDWDFWIGLLALGYHGRRVPELLFFYRKHARGSMLTQAQERRAAMVRRIIEHHRALFAATLEISIATKDEMFFQAHTEAWRLRERGVRSRGLPPAVSSLDNELYQGLLARAELDYIERSRFWRALQKFKRNPLYRVTARLRFGTRWDAPIAAEEPGARLARIKASRSYRFIQLVKRTPLYRWYARAKYGPNLDESPT